MDPNQYLLNEGADRVVARLRAADEVHGVERHEVEGAEVFDLGVRTSGGWAAAQVMTSVCLAGRGAIATVPAELNGEPCPKVVVQLDNPAIPCLLSQYAGWQIGVGKYFAMGSGPMRAVAADETFFKEWEYSERPERVVGVLETGKLPDASVIQHLCDALSVRPAHLTLLAARTASLVGSFQVVARSVETCLHKLHELKFDVRAIDAAYGAAFLPPIPKDDLQAIGHTNDSILYGGEVHLWLAGDDDQIRDVGPRIPSSGSKDYGEPFASIFKRFGGDFYKIDPMLFSPAKVVLHNRSSGRRWSFGRLAPEILAPSFFGTEGT